MLESVAAEPGDWLLFRGSEGDVFGPARLLAIEPCSPIQPGDGRVITTVYERYSDEVLALHFDGDAEPLQATARHPFYSQDRNAWIEAADLQAGETVRTLEGQTRVVRIESDPEPQTVWNLEVDGEHVYY